MTTKATTNKKGVDKMAEIIKKVSKNKRCVQCQNDLFLIDANRLLYSCVNSKCPNYSLVCLSEEDLYETR